ncbi:YihY/virulence factor BrkB family protein [Gemmatimonadota bacterium]
MRIQRSGVIGSQEKSRIKSRNQLIRDTIEIHRENNAGQMAGALSFYLVLSILPLTLLSITLLGTLLGDEAVRNEIFHFLVALSGPETARSAQDFVLAADRIEVGWTLSLLGLGLLLYSASTMFHHLRRSLNQLWGIIDEREPIRGLLLGRWFSMLFALLFQVLLVVLIFLQTLMTAVLSLADQILPALSGTLLHFSDLLLSFGMIFLFIGLIYRILPRTSLSWPILWRGSGLAALLLLIGQTIFSVSLGYRSITTLYGAAGSVLIGLLGVYFAAHIFYLCSAFTGALLRSSSGEMVNRSERSDG